MQAHKWVWVGGAGIWLPFGLFAAAAQGHGGVACQPQLARFRPAPANPLTPPLQARATGKGKKSSGKKLSRRGQEQAQRKGPRLDKRMKKDKRGMDKVRVWWWWWGGVLRSALLLCWVKELRREEGPGGRRICAARRGGGGVGGGGGGADGWPGAAAGGCGSRTASRVV